ncbi:hypothetical protein [Mycoplasma sp. Ms02]|uniref:hypothetical protein n=1 Tax=Mycoplasma sp. Ms02 TaxID=353851 RepID=UPI001C8932C9|nr:hypothetical protein [Mycoplasma sp. Ms02]QZE12601.1 hypothetical protein K4L35_01275 [Mycoplasma sp. Ms02]
MKNKFLKLGGVSAGIITPLGALISMSASMNWSSEADRQSVKTYFQNKNNYAEEHEFDFLDYDGDSWSDYGSAMYILQSVLDRMADLSSLSDSDFKELYREGVNAVTDLNYIESLKNANVPYSRIPRENSGSNLSDDDRERLRIDEDIKFLFKKSNLDRIYRIFKSATNQPPLDEGGFKEYNQNLDQMTDEDYYQAIDAQMQEIETFFAQTEFSAGENDPLYKKYRTEIYDLGEDKLRELGSEFGDQFQIWNTLKGLVLNIKQFRELQKNVVYFSENPDQNKDSHPGVEGYRNQRDDLRNKYMMWVRSLYSIESFIVYLKSQNLELIYPIYADIAFTKGGAFVNEQLNEVLERYAIAEGEKDAKLVADKEAAVAERDEAVGKLDGAIAEKDAAVAERDAAVGKLDAAVAEKEEAVAQKDAAVAERDAAVGKLDDAVAQKEAAVNEKNEVQAKLDALTVEAENLREIIKRHSLGSVEEGEKVVDILNKAKDSFALTQEEEQTLNEYIEQVQQITDSIKNNYEQAEEDKFSLEKAQELNDLELNNLAKVIELIDTFIQNKDGVLESTKADLNQAKENLQAANAKVEKAKADLAKLEADKQELEKENSGLRQYQWYMRVFYWILFILGLIIGSLVTFFVVKRRKNRS